MSVWHSPDASIRTTTWPGPGSGTGRSSMTSGWPKAGTTAARMGTPLFHVQSDNLSLAPRRGLGQCRKIGRAGTLVPVGQFAAEGRGQGGGVGHAGGVGQDGD